MSVPSPNPRQINTHARLILSDWQALRQALLTFSTRLRLSTAEQQHDELNIPLLNDRQIQDALYGPASAFCQLALKQYTMLSEARFEVNIREDITFAEEGAHAQPNPTANPKRDKLLQSLKMNDIRKLQQSLDPLTEKCTQQWVNANKHWANKVNSQLLAQNITLSTEQLSELGDLEPLSELLGRYQDLNLTPPKTKSSGQNFRDYLYLKTYLHLHSHLSKLQQPHDEATLQKQLKPLKEVFNQINKEESFLINNQIQLFATALQEIKDWS